jgi:hypothetical protein
MRIEDIKIQDTADANYVIRKFFNNDLKNMKMSQLEQLILTVYDMGKDSVSTNLEPDEVKTEPAPIAPPAPVKTNPFKDNDWVKLLEDVEIGHSGEFITADNVGRVTSVKEDTAIVLFEAGEEGEMIEINVLSDKLEKVS